MADPKFKVSMVFGTTKILKAAVKEHGIKIEKAIKLVKNDSMRVRATCKPPCECILYASKMQGQPSFQIKTYVPTHNCGIIFYNRQVNSTWLSKKYLETLKANPCIPMQSFKQVVQKEHKVGISRSQVYETKRKAQKLIEGSLMEQYAKFWDYCEEIKELIHGQLS
ncbi:hypothetical protein CsSME_00040659 [Camellia sinensis var. sinensis]